MAFSMGEEEYGESLCKDHVSICEPCGILWHVILPPFAMESIWVAMILLPGVRFSSRLERFAEVGDRLRSLMEIRNKLALVLFEVKKISDDLRCLG